MSIVDKFTTIAENQQKVYDAGYSKGYSKGYPKGVDAGKHEVINNLTEHIDITDYVVSYAKKLHLSTVQSGSTYVDNGGSYGYAFAGEAWGNRYFLNPKEDMIVVAADRMFRNCEMTGNLGHSKLKSNYYNFPTILICSDRMNGHKLDFSNCLYLNQTFRYSKFNYLGVIDSSSALELSAAFADMPNLEEIEKLIIGDNVEWFHMTFDNSPKLRDIRIEGEIKHCIDFRGSYYLSAGSIVSIIEHLSDTVTEANSTATKGAMVSPTVYLPRANSLSNGGVTQIIRRERGKLKMLSDSSLVEQDDSRTLRTDMIYLDEGDYTFDRGYCASVDSQGRPIITYNPYITVYYLTESGWTILGSGRGDSYGQVSFTLSSPGYIRINLSNSDDLSLSNISGVRLQYNSYTWTKLIQTKPNWNFVFDNYA